MSEYDNAIKLIKRILPNKQNSIPLSVSLVEALGDDHVESVVFSQIVYWSERTEDPEGWFFKSYEEFHKETRVKERTCRRKLDSLKSRNWIETEVRLHNGHNQLFIRLDGDNWIEDLIKYFSSPEPDPDKMTAPDHPDNVTGSSGQNDRTMQTKCPDDPDNVTETPIYIKTTTKNTSETTIETTPPTQSGQDFQPEQDQLTGLGTQKKGAAASQAKNGKSQGKNRGRKPKGQEFTDEEMAEYQPLIDIYNQDKPDAWDRANSVTASRVRNLKRLEKEYGRDRMAETMRRALLGAKRTKMATYGWSIDVLIKGKEDWFVQFVEKTKEGEVDSPQAQFVDDPQKMKIQQHLEQSAKVYQMVFGGAA